jgi:hypothetical protein
MVAGGLAASLTSPAHGAVTTTGEVRQPRNLPELVDSFVHTFTNLLTPEELKLFRSGGPEEIKAQNPALYERISRNVIGWTDEWLLSIRGSVGMVSEKRLTAAQKAAERVDALLKRHFEVKGWPYRRMQVVFLPPRFFHDERDRGTMTSGMFIPFYPDAFFASVDWPVPMELLLVHESIHFNSTARRFGRPMVEGITESAARDLVVQYGLLDTREVSRTPVYPSERKGVEVLLEEIMERTGGSRDGATDLLLEAYLTGDQEDIIKIFGAEPWDRVVELSRSSRDWQTHKIKKALENRAP